MTYEDKWFSFLPKGSGVQVDVYPQGARALEGMFPGDPEGTHRSAQCGGLMNIPIAVDIAAKEVSGGVRACLGKCTMKYLRGHDPNYIWHPTKRRYVGNPYVPEWLTDDGFEDPDVANTRFERWVKTRFTTAIQDPESFRQIFLWSNYFRMKRGVMLVADSPGLEDQLQTLHKSMLDKGTGPFKYPHRVGLKNGGPAGIDILRHQDFAIFDQDPSTFNRSASRVWVTHPNRRMLMVVPMGQLLLNETASTHMRRTLKGVDYVIQVGVSAHAEGERLSAIIRQSAPIVWRVGVSPADILLSRWLRKGKKLNDLPDVLRAIKNYLAR